MYYLLLLLNEHRLMLTWLLALFMWCIAYGLYFRHIIRRWFGRRMAHNWSIDLATGKAVTNGKEEVY